MSDHLLPIDLWRVIGSKLDSVADCVRFRAVCKSWMSLLPSRQPPWLLLPESFNKDEENPSDPSCRSFIFLGDEQMYKINLPELHEAHCIGSSGNWLITTLRNNNTMSILNPFSKHQYHFPWFICETVDDIREDEDITLSLNFACTDSMGYKIVLSSSPCNCECIAFGFHFHWPTLVIARPGDAFWTVVQPPKSDIPPAHPTVHDVIFYKKQFHAIHSDGRLLVCDIGDCRNPPKYSFLTDWKPKLKPKQHREIKHYLVEWLDELLLVIKFIDIETESFEVYTFDFVNRNFNELSNLGEHSLFLGFNTSVSVLASDYKFGVRRNCVYFTDDYCDRFFTYGHTGGPDMCVFDLEDKSIQPYYKGLSTPFRLAPVWIVPA